MFAFCPTPSSLGAHLTLVIALIVTATTVLRPLIRISILLWLRLLFLLLLALVASQESITISKSKARYSAVIHARGGSTGRYHDGLYYTTHVRTQLTSVLTARAYLCK